MKERPNYLLAPKYESVFCIFMLVIAYLGRDNPHMAYPQILYLFALLFIQNLIAGITFRFWPHIQVLTGSIVMANCAVTTGILNYSGGIASNLWVLYLLPIYTACMLLPTRYAVWITAGAGSFNVVMYAVTIVNWSTFDVFGLTIKTAVLLSAAVVIHSLVEKERVASGRLVRQREELLRMEDYLTKNTNIFRDQLTHDLLTPIAVIHGSIEILQNDTQFSIQYQPDIDRIQRAIKRCQILITQARETAKKTRTQK